jgi:hypothetical protein
MDINAQYYEAVDLNLHDSTRASYTMFFILILI